MADHYSTMTYMHLSSSRQMPRKAHPLWLGEVKDKADRRKRKAERKAIAAYYRLLRVHPEYGPDKARVAHRYAVVATGSQARLRVRNITA